MAKGSQFERDVCRQFSEWWSGGEREDIFWRTATSGARATTRAKQGKSTFGQCGDIQAVDPIGQPLMDLITFELKRGYPSISPLDVFEPKWMHWDSWIEQAGGSANDAETPYWMIVWKRNRRKSLSFYPTKLHDSLVSVCGLFGKQWLQVYDNACSMAVVPLVDWMEWVSPVDIESVRMQHV